MDDAALNKYGKMMEVLADGAILFVDGAPVLSNAAAKSLLEEDLSALPSSIRTMLSEESGITSCTGAFRRGNIQYDLSCTPLEEGLFVLLRPSTQRPVGDPEGLPIPAEYLGTEYNTMLSDMLVAAQILESRLGRGPEAPLCRDSLAVVGRSCYRLMRLSQNLMIFSQLRHGKRQPPQQPLNFTEFFRKEAAVAERYVKEAGMTLEVFPYPERVVTCADRELCEKLLYNLISNAVKASKPGDTIALRMSVAEGQIHLQVEDHGVGISPELLPYLFESYSRTERDPRKEEGFGLGLALCKEIATLHGGTIALSSKRGEGTRVNASLSILEPLPKFLRDVQLPKVEGFDIGLVELSDVLPSDLYRS